MRWFPSCGLGRVRSELPGARPDILPPRAVPSRRSQGVEVQQRGLLPLARGAPRAGAADAPLVQQVLVHRQRHRVAPAPLEALALREGRRAGPLGEFTASSHLVRRPRQQRAGLPAEGAHLDEHWRLAVVVAVGAIVIVVVVVVSPLVATRADIWVLLLAAGADIWVLLLAAGADIWLLLRLLGLLLAAGADIWVLLLGLLGLLRVLLVLRVLLLATGADIWVLLLGLLGLLRVLLVLRVLLLA